MSDDALEVDLAKAEFEKGDKRFLLIGLFWFIFQNPSVPDWLEEAFVDAFEKGRGYEIKSWDEVFGKPQKKGANLDSRRHKYKKRWEIFHRVRLRNKAGEPIGKELFAAVGKEFGVSGTTAEELYYKVRKLRSSPDPVLLVDEEEDAPVKF
jgi:hypothetical protein